MPELKWLVPKPGRVVRDPATMEPLPPEGAKKPLNTYWLRRLRDGDVSETVGPPRAVPPREKGEI